MTDHKLLPRVPTEEMLAGADKFYSDRVFTAVSAEEIYQAMFDAAPHAGCSECLEQAKIIGMSAEREMALLARVQRLEGALRFYADEKTYDKYDGYPRLAFMQVARAALGEKK